MIFIDNNSIDPYFNLASEEYLLKETEKECFMLWRNSPSIIVGKNQNTLSEIDIDYVEENNIPVVRRLSGGGAVFHDLGNLNFTFIVNDAQSLRNFGKFVQPIIDVLGDLGIEAQFTGRNDLTIGERKFAGNAQANYKNRVLHHGAILFDADMGKLSKALKPKPVKFVDKSVKSVSSRVTNIAEHLSFPLNVVQFKELVLKKVKESYTDSEVIEFNQAEIGRISKIAAEKYSTWEWNFGKSPKYNYEKSGKFKGGTVEVHIQVEKGGIKECRIFGDFFGKKDIAEIETALFGIRHNKEGIYEALNKFNIDDYMFGIEQSELVDLLI